VDRYSTWSEALPITGGTLTGALTGTSATFSGDVGIGGATEPRYALTVHGEGKFTDVIFVDGKGFEQTNYADTNRRNIVIDGTGADSQLNFYRWTGSENSHFGYRFRNIDATDFTLERAGSADLGSHTWTEVMRVNNHNQVTFPN